MILPSDPQDQNWVNRLTSPENAPLPYHGILVHKPGNSPVLSCITFLSSTTQLLSTPSSTYQRWAFSFPAFDLQRRRSNFMGTLGQRITFTRVSYVHYGNTQMFATVKSTTLPHEGPVMNILASDDSINQRSPCYGLKTTFQRSSPPDQATLDC